MRLDVATSGVVDPRFFALGKFLVVLGLGSLGLELGNWVLGFSLGLGLYLGCNG